MAEEDTRLYKMAQRLLTHEAGDSRETPHLTEATDRIFHRLQKQVITYIGSGGYRAVLGRALQLAQGESQLLARIEPSLDVEEGLRALRENLRGLNSTQAEEAIIYLVTRFLGVMADLLGWDITCGLVINAWSELTFSECPTPFSID